MIFHFFTSSLGPLEAELARLKIDRKWNFSNVANQTGLSRLLKGLRRVLKKGKSSECNPQKDEQVKSSPAKTGAAPCSLHGTPKRPGNVFLGCKGHNGPGSIEKSNLSYQVWSHNGPTFKKK